MMSLTGACRLSKAVLKLLSSLGSLNSALRSLDFDFALAPLDGSHINARFSSAVSDVASRLTPDHSASVTVMRGEYALSLDSLAYSVKQRKL